MDKITFSTPLVLASGSRHRAELLRNAGLSIETDPANIDERAVEAPLLGSELGPGDIAQVLAEAKALDVASRHAGKLVIGCDQTLSLGLQHFNKPRNMEEARKHLLLFSGKTHQLHSAIAITFNNETIWRHVSVADMTMRNFSPQFIGRYLAKTGDNALASVGSYQIEGLGIQLFEKVAGDYFTIIGMPLLPLMQELRKLGAIDG